MGYAVKCPSCKAKFPWNVKQGMPKCCPLCGYDTSIPDTDEISMPAFLSPSTKANDKLYRDMERGSEVRAQAAADMLEVPVSEMSALKITDMNDRRDRETSAVQVVNPVTQQMDYLNKRGGNFGFGQNGAEFSSEVQSGGVTVNGQTTQGIGASAGARMRATLQEVHGRTTGKVSTDYPALETLQPGYRKRA